MLGFREFERKKAKSDLDQTKTRFYGVARRHYRDVDMYVCMYIWMYGCVWMYVCTYGRLQLTRTDVP
jgi:hypothetical protein